MKSPCWDPTATLPVSVLFGIKVTHGCFGRGKPHGRLHINRLTTLACDELITTHTQKSCCKVKWLRNFSSEHYYVFIINNMYQITCRINTNGMRMIGQAYFFSTVHQIKEKQAKQAIIIGHYSNKGGSLLKLVHENCTLSKSHEPERC